MQQLSIAVIGMPGHGKSTFLNALANDRKAFEVGAGGASCTQEVSQKVYVLKHEGQAFCVTLVDTMGFPDPNPANTAAYYDSVIECCNRPLNAIIWLVRCERKLHSLVAQYKVLMRELNNASPPIIVVVNGTENYDDDDDRDERKDTDTQRSLEFGRSIASAAGISPFRIIAGAEKLDLKTTVKTSIAMSLGGTAPRTSNMQTFSQLQNEMEQCQNQEAAAKLEMKKQRMAEAKHEQNIVDHQAYIGRLKGWLAGLCWIPFVGLTTSIILGTELNEARTHETQLFKDLWDCKEEVKSYAGSFDKWTMRAEKMSSLCRDLKKALLG